MSKTTSMKLAHPVLKMSVHQKMNTLTHLHARMNTVLSLLILQASSSYAHLPFLVALNSFLSGPKTVSLQLYKMI